MSRSHWIYPSLFFLLVTAMPSSAAPPGDPHREPMPELIYSSYPSDSEYPLFVHRDRILLDDGTVDPSLFAENHAATIKRWYLDLEPVDPCIEAHASTTPFDRPEPEWSNYSSIVEDSDFIVVARVTGVSTGMSLSTPVTLLRLKPIQWLKGKDTWDVKYRIFPAVDITLGNLSLCLYHDEYPSTPSERDRVLVAYDAAVEPNHPWLVTTGPRMIRLQPSGKTNLPRWIRGKHSDWNGMQDQALIGRILQLVHQGNRP